MNTLSSWLASVALLLLPVVLVFQITKPDIWPNRLFLPFEEQTHRHTSRFTQGTHLPPHITNDLTLTAQDSPLIISGSVTIASHAHLIIEKDTMLYANEFASLRVDGKLTINGEKDQEVLFTTNELHPTNQLWNGLLFSSGSIVKIQNAMIEYASPGFSCLKNSQASIHNIRLTHTRIKPFIENQACTYDTSGT